MDLQNPQALVLGDNGEVPLQLPLAKKATLAEAGLYYMYSESLEAPSQMDFVAAQAVAKMVLQVAIQQPQILEKLMVRISPTNASKNTDIR